MTGLVIGPARLDEIEGLCALSESVEHAPQWTRAVWRDALAHGADEARLARMVLVCREGGQIVGLLVASCVAGVVELESMVVETSVQRKGIGRALWDALVLWAKTMGADRISLEVRSSNLRARRFYAAMGCQEDGIRRAYYSSPREDAVLMRASVASSEA